MALEQENLVEKDSARNTVGAFRASGLTDVSRFLQPSLPVATPLAPRNPLTGNYLDRALSGISSFGAPAAPALTPPAVKPLLVANSAADERDANFTRYGTNFPTAEQIAASKAAENKQETSPVYRQRLERFAPSVNYNPSSGI